MTQKLGLLVMHYGTPASVEDILPYYTHIRQGRAPSPEALQDLTDRYAAIGGPSPLSEVSQEQAAAIRSELKKTGVDAALYVATKHTTPFIADAVEKMANDGIENAVGLVLAPHYSSFSIAAYKKYALEARDRFAPGMRLAFVERWGELSEFIDALAKRVQEQMQGWNADETLVVFSAHSLPEKIMAAGDPYKDELLDTCKLVAAKLPEMEWAFAFQSASNTGEPWLGPDILELLSEAAEEGEYKNIVSCTVGFVSDHLEVLYDLGIEARDKCQELGLNFRRAATVGIDPQVMAGLARTVKPLFD
jgi:ferrochelatase